MFQSECPQFDHLDIDHFPLGEISRGSIEISHDGLGNPIAVPVLVARGPEEQTNDSPVVGVTAAVHGNEVNGIPVIHRLFKSLDVKQLRGTVVGVPVVNIPAYLEHDRISRNGFDLNRVMPGRPDGNEGELYAHRLLERVIKTFDIMIDLHTASFGRENALYVRANLERPETRELARLQDPEIIVHNAAQDGTLRAAAVDMGILAVTVEVGNPLRFQSRLIRDATEGVFNVLVDRKMIDGKIILSEDEPVVCSKSAWIYSQHGGILEVRPKVTDLVKENELLATVRNIFGEKVAEYRAPHDGVIIGRSTNPICPAGSRIVHLGEMN